MRQTGRTFRVILTALFHASQGDDVLVVCSTYEAAACACRKAHAMVELYGITAHEAYIRTEYGFSFFLGMLHFTGPQTGPKRRELNPSLTILYDNED